MSAKSIFQPVKFLIAIFFCMSISPMTSAQKTAATPDVSADVAKFNGQLTKLRIQIDSSKKEIKSKQKEIVVADAELQSATIAAQEYYGTHQLNRNSDGVITNPEDQVVYDGLISVLLEKQSKKQALVNEVAGLEESIATNQFDFERIKAEIEKLRSQFQFSLKEDNDYNAQLMQHIWDNAPHPDGMGKTSDPPHSDPSVVDPNGYVAPTKSNYQRQVERIAEINNYCKNNLKNIPQGEVRRKCNTK